MDMTIRTKTCCFTGHRPGKLPWGGNETDADCRRLKRELDRVLLDVYDLGFRHFICGMAIGADMYFGEAVAALRDARGDITLEGAVPFDGQEKRWPDDAQRRYRRLTEACDRLTVLSGEHTSTCMMDRNRYMVDHASLLIAVYDGSSSGGTRNTIQYARREGLEIILLPVSGFRDRPAMW